MLKDGRRLATLDDVRILISELPQARREAAHWHAVAHAMVNAMADQTAYGFRLLQDALWRALVTDGMVP